MVCCSGVFFHSWNINLPQAEPATVRDHLALAIGEMLGMLKWGKQLVLGVFGCSEGQAESTSSRSGVVSWLIHLPGSSISHPLGLHFEALNHPFTKEGFVLH